ncbi:UNVERIFIED_CONTAM: hypothetical protein GTU68_001443 [Idotea baltica]|nr:hypothetical protein [Idotea baltica]
MSCPKVCECKWKQGKVWVICSGAKFIDVPRGLDPSTQVLDLSNNNLQILFLDAFIDRGLINLQKLFLVNCRLRKLDKHSLRTLANLVQLNLSYNSISIIPSEVLSDVPRVRDLRMKRNNLTEVPARAFLSVPDLVHLDLSFNAIETVHKHAFWSLPRLEVLKMSGNRLKTLSSTVFEPLHALHELQLHSNIWDCNCNLISAIEWLNGQNLAVSALPKCSTPDHLAGMFWKDVEPEKLVCVPKVTPLVSRMTVMNGENVTLVCKVETDADARVTWHIGNTLLANESQLLEDHHRYNVFELVTSNQQSQTTVSNLTISEADFQDQGTYRCVVENEAGRVETKLTLQVSEGIKEDLLVAPTEESNLAPILGAIISVTLAMALCIILLVLKRRPSRGKKKEEGSDNLFPLKEQGSEPLSTAEEGSAFAFRQIRDQGRQSPPEAFAQDGREILLEPSSEEGLSVQGLAQGSYGVSYLKVEEPTADLGNAYPDVLLRTGSCDQFCSTPRR